MVLKTIMMDGKRNYYCHFSTETMSWWRALPQTEPAERQAASPTLGAAAPAPPPPQHRAAFRGQEWSCWSRETALVKAWLLCAVCPQPLLLEGSCCAQKEFCCKGSSAGGKQNERTVLCRPPTPLISHGGRRSSNTNLLPFTGDSHEPVRHGYSGGNYWNSARQEYQARQKMLAFSPVSLYSPAIC